MGTSKKIIILLIILVLVGAGVFAYQTFYLSKGAGKKSAVSTTGATANQVKRQEFNDAIKKASAADQDLDGISDSDEAKYQTSVTSSDTDGDGLTDSQEIFIYKTNPLKADTDGDSFTDGYEVRRGFNPNVAEKSVK